MYVVPGRMGLHRYLQMSEAVIQNKDGALDAQVPRSKVPLRDDAR